MPFSHKQRQDTFLLTRFSTESMILFLTFGDGDGSVPKIAGLVAGTLRYIVGEE